MLRELQRQWRQLKSFPVGKRFETHYREQHHNASKLWRVVSVVLAVALLGVGVVFVFIPGPAFVFFILAAGLLASRSLRVARGLDWSELRARAALARLRHWWAARSKAERAPLVLAAVLAVLGVGLAALEVFTGFLSR